MAGRTLNASGGATSTPGDLPSATPNAYGSHDHSFTLQMIMELQKSNGAMSAQLKSISEQLEKIERKQGESESKTDIKIDALSESVRGVRTTITVVSRVGYVVASLAVILIGVLWTVSQDAVKDIAKTAINSTIASAAKQDVDIPLLAPTAKARK